MHLITRPAVLLSAVAITACTPASSGPIDDIPVTFTPTSIELQPRNYTNRPASGDFGLRNDFDQRIYVTPTGFRGDGANILTFSPQQQDIPLAPGQLLLITVSYDPSPTLWQDGTFEAELLVDVGAFSDETSAERGVNPTVRRETEPDRWFSFSKSQDISFSWDCDLDEDGFVAKACGGDDCADQVASIHPEAEERCDGIDNDCNGEIDDSPPNDGTVWYQDQDGDGIGASSRSVRACERPGERWSTTGDDCDDLDGLNFPGNVEVCGDGVDNDCDDDADEDCAPVDTGHTGDTDDTDVIVDTDRDGLADSAEDLDGNGVLDPGETDPLDPDTDDDGLEDGAEVLFWGTDPTSDDSDNDGLTDPQEIFGNPRTDPNLADTDGDGLSDPDEFLLGTNPTLRDTDRDGLTDGEEVDDYNTDPLDPDSDNDQISDGAEIHTYGTDPNDDDSDDDGVLDGREVFVWHSDPNDPDSDDDGLTDDLEVTEPLSDPNDPDSDNDGLDDLAEWNLGTNPRSTDTDGDGLTDPYEVNVSLSNPLKADTDGDGLRDGVEVNVWGSDPRLVDTDLDGLTDKEEVGPGSTHTDPTNPDTDDDGLTDYEEAGPGGTGTDPNDPDFDGDGLKDGGEVDAGTDPRDPDSDDDGLWDGAEVSVGANPLDPDTDDDMLKDGEEVLVYGCNPTLVDSDGDTLSDFLEVRDVGSDCTLADTDGDLLADNYEFFDLGTLPTQADSDGDTLDDGAEVNIHGTSPLLVDTDADGLRDGAEISVYETDPNDDDSDDDLLKDGREIDLGTDPNEPDTDMDGLDDGAEVDVWGSNPRLTDTDGDGLTDGEEAGPTGYGSDPTKRDSDRDGLDDDVEVGLGTSPALVDTDGDRVNDKDELDLGTDPTVFNSHNIRGGFSIGVNQLVISEIMVNPRNCSDDDLEYIEVVNVTSSVFIDMKDVSIDMLDGFARPLSLSNAPDFILLPGERALIRRRTTSTTCAPNAKADYDWQTSRLNNFGDTVSVRGTTGMSSKVIDNVNFQSWGLPPNGASMTLDPTRVSGIQNDDQGSWCPATSVIANTGGDKGTPKAPNDRCFAPPDTGDSADTGSP